MYNDKHVFRKTTCGSGAQPCEDHPGKSLPATLARQRKEKYEAEGEFSQRTRTQQVEQGSPSSSWWSSSWWRNSARWSCDEYFRLFAFSVQLLKNIDRSGVRRQHHPTNHSPRTWNHPHVSCRTTALIFFLRSIFSSIAGDRIRFCASLSTWILLPEIRTFAHTSAVWHFRKKAATAPSVTEECCTSSTTCALRPTRCTHYIHICCFVGCTHFALVSLGRNVSAFPFSS